ncbi:hypothetical protein ACLX1H_007413 [Fusarium chlamydosporum]
MIPTTATITPEAAWPTTQSALRELLGIDKIDNEATPKCHGQCKTKKRCKTPISRGNFDHVTRLLDQIVHCGSVSASKSVLLQVSQLIMCKKNHRDQAPQRLSLWETILKPLEIVVVKKEVEDDTLTTRVEDVVKLPDTETIAVKHEVFPKSQKSAPKTTHRRTSQSTPSAPMKPSTSCPTSIPSKQSSLQTSSSKHEFEDFGPHWTTIAKNKCMKKLLLRPLKKSEKSSDGFIYVYTFPETYRDAHPYIKIGYAHNVDKRMRDWKTQCGYDSKLFGQFTAEHYVKVEKLVHCQLRNQRKREKGCPTCHVWHQEWFKIDSPTACMNIMMWTSWMRQKPYDDEGKLQEKWRVRIEGLDMTDPSCWELLTKGVFDDDADESELSEEGDSFAWSNDDESEFSGHDDLEDVDIDECERSLTEDKCGNE